MAETIKEFLVSLSYKIDGNTFRQFQESIKASSKVVAQFAAGLAAMGAALAVAAAQTSAALEKLYYESQRTGASVANLKALGFAASQFGSSAEEAVGAAERLAKMMRDSPGYARQLHDVLGVNVTSDASKNLQGFMDAISKLPAAQRNAWLRSYGFSENLFFAFQNPNFKKEQEDERNRLSQLGFGADAAENATKLQQSLRGLKQTLVDLSQGAQAEFFSQYGDDLKRLDNYLREHGREIADVLKHIFGAILQIVEAIVKALPEIDKAIGGENGWVKVFEALAAVLLLRLVPGLTSMVAMLGRLVAMTIPPWLLAMLGLGTASVIATQQHPEILGKNPTPLPETEAEEGLGGIAGLWRRRPKWLGGKGNNGGILGRPHIGKAMQSKNAEAVADELRKAGLPNEGIAAAMGSIQTESGFNPRAHNDKKGGHTGLIQWDRVRRGKVKAWIEGQGGDPYDARWQARAFVAEGRARPGDALYDGRQTERGFRSLEESKGNIDRAIGGMRDIERFGYGEEGGRGANARAWLPKVVIAPQADNKLPAGGYWAKDGKGNPVAVGPDGKAIQQSLPPKNPLGGFDVRALQDAIQKSNPVGQIRQQPAAVGPQSWNSSTTHVNAPQTVSFHIDGSGNPAEVGRYIAGQQSRVNGDLIRNLQGAIA